MERRKFLKMLALGSAVVPVLGWPELGTATTPIPFAEHLPDTPSDAPPGTWTLAVLPDTQNYAEHFPAVFGRQSEWIVAHAKKHDIRFVLHEGDLTENNVAAEWQNAHHSLNILTQAHLPYALVTGNHDLGPEHQRAADRSTLLNEHFTEADYRASERFGLFEPGKLQNSWHVFTAPTGKYLVVALEFGPRDSVVAWADKVLADHADHRAILLTHAYLFHDSTRFDWTKFGERQSDNPKGYKGLVADGNVNDGQDLWDKLVAKHANIVFTLNGHVCQNGTGYLASPSPAGQTVHQILANYQEVVQVEDGAGGAAVGKGGLPHRAYGGGGFLRLMQFWPDGKTVAIKTYSPWYDRWLTQPDQQFILSLA